MGAHKPKSQRPRVLTGICRPRQGNLRSGDSVEGARNQARSESNRAIVPCVVHCLIQWVTQAERGQRFATMTVCEARVALQLAAPNDRAVAVDEYAKLQRSPDEEVWRTVGRRLASISRLPERASSLTNSQGYEVPHRKAMEQRAGERF